ncbi:MAG: hypothetical protein AB8B55_11105, partial [Mariniblastus sp.]
MSMFRAHTGNDHWYWRKLGTAASANSLLDTFSPTFPAFIPTNRSSLAPSSGLGLDDACYLAHRMFLL